MYGITEEAKRQIIKAYQAFLERALEKKESNLTRDERKAIGQKVLDDILETSFRKFEIMEDAQEAFRSEFEKIIRDNFPDSLYDTPFRFTGKSYEEKK